jgi:uncharacterized membrane protein YdbT with pleckstrin-like domain
MKVARDFLGDEFVDDLLGPLAGKTEDGDLVFRPAVRAAFGPALLALTGLLVVFVPFLLGFNNSGFGEEEFNGVPKIFFWVFWLADNIEFAAALLPATAPIINVLTTRYVLAADGIRERKQFLNKEERKVSWEKVTALKHKRSILDRILGIERLDVVAYGERGVTLHLIGLRDASQLRNHVGMRMRQSASVDALMKAD